MPIAIKNICIIIPMHKLKKRCSERISPLLLSPESIKDSGNARSRDAHLYCEMFTRHLDVQLRIEWWKRNGLRPTRIRDGVIEWNDLCVVDSFEGLSLPCRWLRYNPDKQSVWLSGTPGDETAVYEPETIIFLHGKESTPETSSSAQAVKEFFCNDLVLVPDYRPLEHTHDEVERYLSAYIADSWDSVLVGISLGGYWSYRMSCLQKAHVRSCVMLNPSFNCYPEVPILNPPYGLPISLAVNLDDDVVNPQAAIERFKNRCGIYAFEKGGHRFDNKSEMCQVIKDSVNTCSYILL